MSWWKVGMSATIALAVALTAGLVLTQPAASSLGMADVHPGEPDGGVSGDVTCVDQGSNPLRGGWASASECEYGGERSVRLAAACRFTPWSSYSPWTTGPFEEGEFVTPSCAFGVRHATFEHGAW